MQPAKLYNETMDKLQQTIRSVLEQPFWLPDLKPGEHYFRTHDDCEGELQNGIKVIFSEDGDAWVETTSEPFTTCRYRMPIIGGGRSPRVRNALLILALAIKLDNEDDPLIKK